MAPETVGIREFYTFLLVFARLSGLIAVAPLFSHRAVPRTARAGFALLFSLALTPLVVPLNGPVPAHLLVLVGDVLKNALFGLAVGFAARLLFAAVEMAGYFIDMQMGFGMMNVLNPFTEQQDSVLSMFQFQLATTLYLIVGGHLMLLGAAAESFRALPPGSISPAPEFGLVVVPLLKSMFALGFRMALPAAGVLFVVDAAFGLIARLAPQINVFIVGTPAKIIVGLATVALLLPALALFVAEIVAATGSGLDALIAGAK